MNNDKNTTKSILFIFCIMIFTVFLTRVIVNKYSIDGSKQISIPIYTASESDIKGSQR